jgi:cytochrome d ubiquinol oxidase subunit II
MALQATWFFLWGLLWAIFFITDGFDFGVGTLYPFLGKNETDKRIMINALGPLWDGNEVWLITAGGVTFAAFPPVYATMFSTLYSPLMLILFALILRGVSFEFRAKAESAFGKRMWDISIFVGSFFPALLFGVAFANIFQGIPFDADRVYQGTLLTLLNPYGLLGGVLFLSFFLMHGALWLCIKTENDLQARAEKAAHTVWAAFLGLAVLFLIASAFATDLYGNYFQNPILFLLILLNVLAIVAVKYYMNRKTFFKAWFASSLAFICCTFFGIIGLFPNMFPSSLNAAYNLTAFNASSSPLTLKIMLIVVILFIPIVLLYQIWAYTLFKGKVGAEDLEYEEAY